MISELIGVKVYRVTIFGICCGADLKNWVINKQALNISLIKNNWLFLTKAAFDIKIIRFISPNKWSAKTNVDPWLDFPKPVNGGFTKLFCD